MDFVILYGSQVKRGQKGPETDVDIAVYRRGGFEPDEYLDLYARIGEAVDGGELDMKSLSRQNFLFQYQVVNYGRLIYGNRTDYNDFKAYVYRKMVDGQSLLELQSDLVYKYQKELKK